MSSSLCAKPEHDNQKIKYLCLDRECSISEKIGCADCFLEDHPGHQRIHGDEFISSTQAGIKQLSQIKSEHIGDLVLETQSQIDSEFQRNADLIIERLTNVKNLIKQQIIEDAEKIRLKQDEIKQAIDVKTSTISYLDGKQLANLNQQQLNSLIDLYLNFDNLNAKQRNQLNLLNQEKEMLRSKHNKYMSKLNRSVSKLLREFNDDTCEQDVPHSPVGGEKKSKYEVTTEKKKAKPVIDSQSLIDTIRKPQKKVQFRDVSS